jgi:glycerol-3-phosphate acyltransferase PlsY
VISLAVVALAGYLLGSIPSGLLIGRWMGGVDIRQVGSGRTGATNAMRSLGARGFALTFLADVAKAVLAVLIARTLVGEGLGPLVGDAVAALAAIVGHNWSVYIGFGGGRGVATSFGAMLMLYWPGALVGLVAAALLIGTTRYVSLGSLGGTVVGLLVAIGAVVAGGQPPALAAWGLAVAILIVWQHRDNIQRLLTGTERRIGQRTEPFKPA